jgi:D-alanine-D-alanine ligase
MKTGASVLASLDTDEYEPIDVVITKSGEWLSGGYTHYPEQILGNVDIAFLALHGTYGEDGTVQRLLDRYAVPYTGSGAYASGIAMHKVLTKDHLRDNDILLAPHMVVTGASLKNIHTVSDSIADMFGPEYVIKPVASGSSVGVTIAKNRHFLPQILARALEHYDEVLVEKKITGKEATCGVVENYRNAELYALPVIEIVPPKSADFFDNVVKYDDTTDEICPGRFTRDEKQVMEDVAKRVHQILGLSQYSRSDFIVSQDGIYFLEVNTLPGLTESSLFPKAIYAVGGTYKDFINHLISDRLERKV